VLSKLIPSIHPVDQVARRYGFLSGRSSCLNRCNNVLISAEAKEMLFGRSIPTREQIIRRWRSFLVLDIGRK